MRISHAEGCDFTHYPITLKIHHVKNVHIFFEYRTDLLDGATVQSLGRRLIRLLEKVRYKWRRRKTLVRFVVLLLDRFWSEWAPRETKRHERGKAERRSRIQAQEQPQRRVA